MGCRNWPGARNRPRCADLNPECVGWTHVPLLAGSDRWEACPTPSWMAGHRTRARLLISQGTGQVAVRRAAGRLEATAARSGYRRRRQLVHPPDADALVAAATERARDGDDDALRLLFLLYADNLFGYVLAIVRDEHDAEDITSEVFARLPRALSHYKVSATPFAAWLLRVARNAALDHLRAQRSVPLAEVPGHRHEELHAHERLDDLRAALEKLPADQRHVIILRLIAGLTPAEGAQPLRPPIHPLPPP